MMRGAYFVLFGTLIFIIITAQTVLGSVQDKTAKNMTTSIGNSTVAMKRNITNTAGNSTSNNNVTAAAGNNGHIYRGGAAAGSGGE
jgi:hypothetical protein